MNYIRKGLAFIICAPSGTGKTTLAKKLLAEFDNLTYSISCTTRHPRKGEVDGEDYHFISKEEFATRCADDAFIEWAEVHGNFYGTLRSETVKHLQAGKDILFDIDVQGAAQIKINMPEDIALAFIAPPSLSELEVRLRARGTDAEDVIRRRLSNARSEITNAHWFDFIVVNDQLDKAYAKLKSAYIAATLVPRCKSSFLNALFKEATRQV